MSTETTPQAASKSLADMTAEIVENNRKLGWHDNPPSFWEAMAMLHSEVSEALEAWRVYGLADATKTPWSFNDEPGKVRLPKPEGVGSEFADILIRLLDDIHLYCGVNPDTEEAKHAGRYATLATFPENMCKLHVLIARASEAEASDGHAYPAYFGAILIFLRQLAELYGVDLNAEYERKAAYNRTRAFRHGGKRL